MLKKTIIQISIPVPLPQIFDYFCFEKPKLGTRVLVSFGARKIVGVVIGLDNFSCLDAAKIKIIERILDKKPTLNNEILYLCRWMSRYYHAPIGECLSLAIPKILRKNQKLSETRINYIWHTKGELKAVQTILKSAKKQWELWQFINDFKMGISNRELNDSFKQWHSFAKNLLEKKLLSRDIESEKINNSLEKPLELNDEQKKVVADISLKINSFKVHLIDGITGSGKTEVYLQLIEKSLKSNKQILILVPEISLTPQTSQRFKKRFNVLIQTQHSKLTDNERFDIWRDCQSNKTKILISTRSGLFNPLPNLGLIIVDEEHDLSFKQQDGIRYSAKDMAIVRAKNLNIPIILGSATPSLETFYQAQNSRFQWHHLTKRAGNAKPSVVQINDIGIKNPILSEYSLKKIDETIKNGLQVMIFINRRGFSPALYCKNCGTSLQCPNCEANLTVHKNPPKLICHHCEFNQNISSSCGQCGGALLMLGAGTEKIEQLLNQRYPTHKILRIDKDTTRKKQAWRDLYHAINNNKTRILIGTQMLAKGHHFPKVALVVIIGVDNGLMSADFRSTEHLAQLITQVSGRAGRAANQGLAIIQTRQPNHPILKTLLTNGYGAVCRQLLDERKIAQFPPFSSLCIIRAHSKVAEYAKDWLMLVKQSIKNYAENNIGVLNEAITALGPLPAPMEKRLNNFRFQLVLQADNKTILQRFLINWVTELYQIKNPKKIRWSLDIDPVNLL